MPEKSRLGQMSPAPYVLISDHIVIDANAKHVANTVVIKADACATREQRMANAAAIQLLPKLIESFCECVSALLNDHSFQSVASEGRAMEVLEALERLGIKLDDFD